MQDSHMTSKHRFHIEGREVVVKNLDKVFYPNSGFSKGQVIDYYIQIAPFLLPHLRGRPLTLKRYPDGVEGAFVDEKQCPPYAPLWIKTTRVKRSGGPLMRYCLLNDLSSLVWAANIANLELHPFQHHASAPKRPTSLVFDLDPGAPAGIVDCGQVALWIRDIFDSCGLRCLPKTSGSKGLQIVVPLNTSVTYERTKAFARRIAEYLEGRFPGKVISGMRRLHCEGKVFIDWSQNDDRKATVCVYSLRAKDSPVVSTPLRWGEVEYAVRTRKSSVLVFDAAAVLKRTSEDGDLFAESLSLSQSLPPIRTVHALVA